VDLVVGTSVGSLIGALYADTGKVLDLEFTAIGLTEEDIFDSAIFNLPSGGLVKGARLEEFLRRHLRHQKIQEMAIPFAAVAVELWSGRTAVFKTGDVVPAVHASCAIPGIFVPFTYGERVYVDGGVTNPVPASEARKLGADLVIAVAIPPNIRRQETKSPLAIVHQAITVMAAEIGRLRAQEADVVITPEVGDVFFNDFSRKKELIEAGEAAARAAMPAIRAALAARTRAMASQP
jgi:NTE family protein